MKRRTQKRQKGRVTSVPQIGQKGKEDYYQIISEGKGRLTEGQLTTLEMTIKRKIPSGVKIQKRLYGTYPVTAKPIEVRMGKGKGGVDHKIARVSYNTIIMEVKPAVSEGDIKRELEIATKKLPIGTKVRKPEHHPVIY